MKKILLAASAALLLVACNDTNKATQELQAKLDSLTLINEGYEQDLAETDSLVAAVLTNFQDINTVEGMINVRPGQELSMTQKDRIKDNMTLINDKLRASSEALDALTQKLEASGGDNKRLRSTITALKKDLEIQKQRILSLTEELARKDIAINALDSIVTGLNSDVERLNEATSRQAATLAAQEHELNTVRYCIGTKGDLKDYRLLQGGNIVTDNAELSYFTTADQRKLSQIPLHSRKAKLMTTHPSSSYELISDSDKNLTLNIKDHKAFWSASKMLVIQVD
ncbi:MAG: hypothetical protein SPK09_02325 [Porphyromonas sp.]|nr:hypothetical protein [Porphyromonas sp.]